MKEQEKTGVKPFFVSVEGVDGAGKSTNMDYIAEVFREKTGREIVFAKDPGGTPVAQKCRETVKNNQMGVKTATMLFYAARSSLIDEVINPALEEGKIVISDRFNDSTFAYQCGAGGLDAEFFDTIDRLVVGDRQPDMTIFFDVPLDVSKSRRDTRGKNEDWLEQKLDRNFMETRQAYFERINRNPQRYAIVDGSLPLAKVRMEIENAIDAFVKKNEIAQKNESGTQKKQMPAR